MPRILFLTVPAILCGLAAWAESHVADANGADSAEPAATAQDVDLEAAEAIFERNCRACHGNKAQGVASYPKLSDKDPEYIADRLRTYRAGERIGPNSVLMIQSAEGLSDEEIAGLAVYVTSAFE